MAKQPNVLIFMTDHQRGDTMPMYNWCKMPNLEEMARESVTFTDAMCPSPHCCPARATFFSGLYPSDHGVWNNVNVGNTLSRGLAANVRLWSEDMKDAGYSLYFSGKWHVSNEESPADRGFTHVYHKAKYTGVQPSNVARVADTYEWARYKSGLSDMSAPREEAEIKREGYPQFRLYGEKDNPFNDETVVDASVKHIEEVLPGEKNPWCMYVGTLGPHDPYCLPQRFLDMYDRNDIEFPANYRDSMADKPALYQKTQAIYNQLSDDECKEAIRHYMAFCSYEDYLFGRLVDALKKKGLYDDTMIVYISDHGDYVGAHGLFAKGLPCFREAYSIPLVVRMPGGTQTGVVSDPVSLADFAPTILDVAGIKAERRFAGISLKPYLTGGETPPRREYRFTQTNGNELYGIQRSVSSDKWKYVYNGFDYDELYDLENDPGELCNLSRDVRYKDVIRDMSKVLWQFAYDNNDVGINPYIMVTHAPYGPGIIFE